MKFSQQGGGGGGGGNNVERTFHRFYHYYWLSWSYPIAILRYSTRPPYLVNRYIWCIDTDMMFYSVTVPYCGCCFILNAFVYFQFHCLYLIRAISRRYLIIPVCVVYWFYRLAVIQGQFSHRILTKNRNLSLLRKIRCMGIDSVGSLLALANLVYHDVDIIGLVQNVGIYWPFTY